MLMDYPPLGVLTNGLLASFNELRCVLHSRTTRCDRTCSQRRCYVSDTLEGRCRSCALYSLREGVYEVVNAALTNAALEIRSLHKQVWHTVPSALRIALTPWRLCGIGSRC
jgi:hypothetical protein